MKGDASSPTTPDGARHRGRGSWPIGTTVGPYRIEERLGAGGMGAVYRAFDRRLGRAVAIKHVRPELAAKNERAHRRFRREARIAARLSHPAIVPIFDLVDTGEGDWIVMELVAGRTLRQCLDDGALPLGDVLRWAAEIADGLDEAHGKDVVHRDLKAENVLITPAGHARILDFGVAKVLDPEEGPALSTGDRLSVDGALIGTCASMSPEQARAQPVDHRSDLFALGSLLYELLTGVSPFAAATALDTLNQIVAAEPEPIETLEPAVPPAVRDLVARLLRKEPAHRPQRAAEVAAALRAAERALDPTTPATPPPRTAYDAEEAVATLDGSASPLPTPAGSPTSEVPRARSPRHRAAMALAAALSVLALGLLAVARLGPGGGRAANGGAESLPPRYVAIAMPEVGAEDPSGDAARMASGVRMALARAVLDLEGVAALAFEQVDALAGPPTALARGTGADEVLASRVGCAAGACDVTLSRIAGSDGSLTWTQAFAVPADDALLTATVVANHLRRAFAELPERTGTRPLAVRTEDYQRLLELRRRQDRAGGDLDAEAIAAGIDAVIAGSPGFPDAYLFAARAARQRFADSRRPADLERAIAMSERARELAPTSPEPLVALAFTAIEAGRRELAAEALDQLEALEPGDADVMVQRALLLERQARPAEALDRMRRAVAQRPSVHRLFNLASLEYRQGETGPAVAHLEALLALAPDYRPAQAVLAEVELLYGNAERATALWAELAAREPSFSALSNLGLAHLLLGRWAEATPPLARARDLAPDNATAALNLADARALAGDRTRADDGYRRVLALTADDPDPDSWQTLIIRAQALAHLGERRPAVAAIQRALQAAPENGEVAFAAALVYAVAGDLASAAVNAERAQASGVGRRWFGFPWFDGLDLDPAPDDAGRR